MEHGRNRIAGKGRRRVVGRVVSFTSPGSATVLARIMYAPTAKQLERCLRSEKCNSFKTMHVHVRMEQWAKDRDASDFNDMNTDKRSTNSII